MESDEVLDLLRTVPERYETVRAALHYRGDGSKIKAICEQFLRSDTSRHISGGPSKPPETIQHPNPTALPGGGVSIKASTGRRRLPIGGPPGSNKVWYRRTDGGSRRDDPPWLRLAGENFWTMYPFDPAGYAGIDLELGLLDLSVEEGVTWAGREAVRLRGVPVEEWEYPPEPMWCGADEYEAVVDAERGVLLRLASRLGGEDVDSLEVDEIFFDERFDEGVFASREPLPWR